MEQKTLKGSCLCGQVTFATDDPVEILYHCHCSLCRKVSGTSGNAVFFLPVDRFRWLTGKSETTELVVTTSTAEGNRNVVICNGCGSSLPVSFDGVLMCVPVGLLDTFFEPKLVLNHHLADKGWSEPIADYVLHTDGWPDGKKVKEIKKGWTD